MKELEIYVEKIFYKYRNNPSVTDLKEEVLSNLEAKVVDLQKLGMAYEEAIHIVTKDRLVVDEMIEDNKQVFVAPLIVEWVEIALLYQLVAWILTIPLRILYRGGINTIFMSTSLITGIFYIVCISCKLKNKLQLKRYFNIEKSIYLQKVVWGLWMLFVGGTTLATTAILFGSNIWFGRKVTVDGPYAFAMIVIRYFTPFLSIIIPLIISQFTKLIAKYEVGEKDEC